MSSEGKKEKVSKKELRENVKAAMEKGDLSAQVRALWALLDRTDFENSIMYSQHIDKWKAREHIKEQKMIWEQKKEAAKGKRARYEDTTNPLD